MPTCLVHNCEAVWRFCLADLTFTFVLWSNLLIPITATISHIDDNPDWVNAPIPVPTPVFQTPPVANHNPINNQLAEVLRQLSENLNRGSAPKPYQSKAHILDTFNSSDPHKLNHFLFQCWFFFCANPLQFSTDKEKINFAMTYLSGVAQDWFEVAL